VSALKYNRIACDTAHDAFLDDSNIQNDLSAAQSLIMGATYFVICGSSFILCARLFAIRNHFRSAVNNSLLAQLTEDSGVSDVISKQSMQSIKKTLNFRYLFVLIWTIVVILARAIFETLFGLSGFSPQNDNCDVCASCQTNLFMLFTILVNEPIIQAR
jgi:hypothetical protein